MRDVRQLNGYEELRTQMSNGRKFDNWWRRIVLAMSLGCLICPRVPAQTVLIDDFDDRNLGGWDHVDSTLGQPYGPGTFSAESESFQLEGGGTIHAGVPGAGFLASFWEPSSDDRYSQGFVRARIRANTRGSLAALMVRMSGSIESGLDGYGFFGTTAANGQGPAFAISRLENSINTRTWRNGPSDFAAGDDWYLEAGAVDDRITLKAWAHGEPEPDAPQIVVFDDRIEEGRLGVESNIHAQPFAGPAVVSATFDDIYFTFPGPDGDFNNDGDLGLDDLESLIAHMNDDGSLYFDVTGDKLLNNDDFDHWVVGLRGTWYGDANLDGEFNSGDLVDVFAAAFYETGDPATWSQGDWNGDRIFDSSDLVAAFADGGYEKGTRTAVAAVPEPSTLSLPGLLALAAILRIRRLPS